MLDPQHIVERIRAFLASTDETRTPELQEVAEAYAGLCREANARLRRCHDYLRRGLRAEAIHGADEEPNLLDQIALLDIPEARQWIRTCATYDLTRPPPLVIDAAQELNAAYAIDRPLRALLDRHRKLALQRAPLAQRLAVLRELADTDSVTPFWAEDVATFEAVRLKDLGVEAAAAATTGDRTALARLREEVQTGGWRAPIPRELRQLLDRTDAAWRQKDGERQVRELLPELDTAYGAMDFEASTRLLRQIKQLVDYSLVEVPDDIVARVTPVRDWVSAERHRRERLAQFEAACDQLSLAIHADAPEYELNRLKREALGVGDELPSEISHKMRQLSAAREAARVGRIRRKRLIIGGVVLAFVVGSGLVVRATIRDRNARNAFHALSSLVGKEQWDEAAQAWDRLPGSAPGAADRSDFKDLRRQIDDALARDQSRRTAFHARMKAAAASGSAAPDSTALAEAEALAKTADEKAELGEFLAQVETARREVQRQMAEAAKRRLASLASDVAALEQQAKAGKISATNALLATTESGISSITSTDPLPAELKREAESVGRRLKGVRDGLARSATEREAVDLVVRGSSSPVTLREALLAYARQLPDSPHAPVFKQTAEDAAAWEAVEEAAKLIDSWEGKPQPPPSQILPRVQGLAVYVGKFPESVFVPTFNDLRQYLMDEQRALAADGPWKGELATLLSSPILKDLKSIHTIDGKIYYLLPDAAPQSESLGLSFNAVLSGDTSNTRRVTLKPSQVSGGLTDSPQALLVRDLLKKLASLNESDWDTFGLDAIDSVITQKDVDPVLRVILLGRLAKFAQAGVWGAGDAIKALESTTSTLNAADIAWMNPTDGPAAQTRETAAAILAQLAPLKELRAAIIARRDAMFKSVRLKLTGRAVLLRDGDAWTAVASVKPVPRQQAWVVAMENGHKVLRRIGGTTEEGRIALDADAVRGVGDGTMVFITAPP